MTTYEKTAASGVAGPDRKDVVVWILGILLVIAIGAALRAMTAVAVPVIFAVLITLVMAPLHARLERMLPDWAKLVALLGVMVLLLGIIALFVGALVFAAERVLAKLPDVSGGFQSLLPSGEGASALLGGRVQELWSSLGSNLGGRLVDQISGLAQAIAGMTGAFVTTLVLILFLVMLAVSERSVWRGKMKSLSSGAGIEGWAEALNTVAARLRRFLVIRTAVGLLQAVLYVVWLWYFGIDLLFVWAILTFVLTYIPNLGSIIAGSMPVLYVLVTKDWQTALGVAAGLFVIEQVVGNYLDPRLLGRQIALSPFIILAGLLFWGSIWGAVGAFLATPIMLSLLVIFNTVPHLRPVALLLSDQKTPEALDEALAQE